jgi:hypothetical protein
VKTKIAKITIASEFRKIGNWRYALALKTFALNAFALITLLALTLSSSGCAIVDQNPAKPTVTDPKAYFYSMDSGTYYYHIYGADNRDEWEDISITMRGRDPKHVGTADSNLYVGTWKDESHYHDSVPCFFGITKSRALYFGRSMGSQLPMPSVDLQLPLAKDSTWTFYAPPGMLTTANVTQFDVQLAFNGVAYPHVIEVTYVTKRGTTLANTTVKWFAKGLGLIRSVTTDFQGTIIAEWRLISKEH